MLDALRADFMNDRRIVLDGEINQDSALQVILSLWKLTKKNNKDPIYIFINSPGGEISAGLSIIDAMRYVKVPIYTFCYSLAESMAAVILAAGDKRFAFKHSTIMIHQPLTAANGYVKQSDLSDAAHKLEAKRKEIETMLSEYSKGKSSYSVIHKACDKDNFMGTNEALKLGLIDEIV